ncbi:recombinase A [Haematococcus lacustris]|uniref:Recombinase A n=1 Tax=Haematococcus lacustris TaxID=44745 RepID=A0A699ZJE8_HAELA|nr:recombinase A [Haematococcus lacustris]
MALDITDELARSGAVDLIVVDSVSSLVARQELENDLGAPTVGLQARMMSQALRKLVGSCSKTGCSIIFINQIRMKVGVMFGSPETTSGGQALKYYTSVRIDVRKKDIIGVKEKAEGIKVMAKIVKNKVAPPFRTAMFSILFASGLDRVGGIMDAAEGAGVLDKRAGGCYYYQDNMLGRGYDKVLEMLRTDQELCKQIEVETRAELNKDPELAGALEDESETEDGDPGAEFTDPALGFTDP